MTNQDSHAKLKLRKTEVLRITVLGNRDSHRVYPVAPVIIVASACAIAAAALVFAELSALSNLAAVILSFVGAILFTAAALRIAKNTK